MKQLDFSLMTKLILRRLHVWLMSGPLQKNKASSTLLCRRVSISQTSKWCNIGSVIKEMSNFSEGTPVKTLGPAQERLPTVCLNENTGCPLWQERYKDDKLFILHVGDCISLHFPFFDLVTAMLGLWGGDVDKLPESGADVRPSLCIVFSSLFLLFNVLLLFK